MNSNKIHDVLIVGAGMTGISAGNYLLSKGRDVILLDKGHAVGGRMASKRIECDGGKVTFDYGCRYLDADNVQFIKALNSLYETKNMKYWNIDLKDYSSQNNAGRNKIISKTSIRDIALELSKKLDIMNNALVNYISWNGENWKIFNENGNMFNSYAILLTMPVPQIINLLKSSKIEMPLDIMSDLTKVEYERNIVGMLILESESELKNEGGLRFNEGDISFITDNNLKGINKCKTAVTVEMSNEFSIKYWDLSDEDIFFRIIEAAKDYLGSSIINFRIHRWKFSKPSKPYKSKFESLNNTGPLFLAGDAFGGSTVESAYFSGLQTAAKIQESLFTHKKMEVK